MNKFSEIIKSPLEVELTISMSNNGIIEYYCYMALKTGHKIEIMTQHGAIEINPGDTAMTVTEMFHAQVISREFARRYPGVNKQILNMLFSSENIDVEF